MSKELVAHDITTQVIKYFRSEGFTEGVFRLPNNKKDAEAFSLFFDNLRDLIQEILDNEEP